MSRLLTDRIEVVIFMAIFYRVGGGVGMRKKYRLPEAAVVPAWRLFSIINAVRSGV
jgi:hypothetical protein